MGFNGVHIALTVNDLSVSGPWYQKLFDGQQLFAGDDGAGQVELYMVPDNLLLGLRQHGSTSGGDRFAYDRVGLDHVGLHLADRAELEKWDAKLNEMGIESSGIVESSYGAHVNFKDPDGIALELFVVGTPG
ncbi:MAG TPA: VOC family protein [Actinomycetota bacterium]|jgi:catechol-2,3-dioxygenase